MVETKVTVGAVVSVVEDELSILGFTIFTTTAGEDSETKKKYGENDEYMFHLVSYYWFRRTQYITSIGLIYKNVGILLGECLTMKN